MREEARWWYDTALRDLAMSEAALAKEIYEGCAFHCQQTAEKALKAVLAARGEHSRTHTCVRLLEELRSLGLETASVETPARRLDPHYLTARYPNGGDGPPEMFYDEEIATALLEDARKVLEFARAQLGL